jgi:hypothetical protein
MNHEPHIKTSNMKHQIWNNTHDYHQQRTQATSNIHQQHAHQSAGSSNQNHMSRQPYKATSTQAQAQAQAQIYTQRMTRRGRGRGLWESTIRMIAGKGPNWAESNTISDITEQHITRNWTNLARRGEARRGEAISRGTQVMRAQTRQHHIISQEHYNITINITTSYWNTNSTPLQQELQKATQLHHSIIFIYLSAAVMSIVCHLFVCCCTMGWCVWLLCCLLNIDVLRWCGWHVICICICICICIWMCIPVAYVVCFLCVCVCVCVCVCRVLLCLVLRCWVLRCLILFHCIRLLLWWSAALPRKIIIAGICPSQGL